MIHIMLDLETWGTSPGSDIRSIGACLFDPVTRYIGDHGANYLFYIATDNPITFTHSPDGQPYDEPLRKYPLSRDPQTAQWWAEQSDEAQAAFANPVDLREALERFTNWLAAISNNIAPFHANDIRIWSHGAAFDPPILAAAYAAVGLPVPWHYRAPRDTRTLFDLAGITDHSAWLNQHPGPLAVPHHALDDAICQARAVVAAYARIAVMIDWNAPLELMDGTPVRLTDDSHHDPDGDYWIERDDSAEIGSIDVDGETYSIHKCVSIPTAARKAP